MFFKFLDLLFLTERAAPTVVSCPDNIEVTSSDRTTFVSWPEPVFDNARLVQSNYMQSKLT